MRAPFLMCCVALSLCGCAPTPAPANVSYSPDKELELSAPGKRALLNFARVEWDGGDGVNMPAEVRELANPLILTAFSRKGTLLAERRIDDAKTGLDTKLREAVKQLRAKISGNEHFRGDLKGDIFLHVQVITYVGRFPNFGKKGIFEYRIFEPRVTGIRMEIDGKVAEITPLEQLYRNLDGKMVRKRLAKALGVRMLNTRHELWTEIYRTTHFGEAYPGKAFTEYQRGHKIFTAEMVDPETVKESLHYVGKWYEANVIDGEVTYQYGPFSQKYLNHKRTMVRSTMAVWVLNKLAAFNKDEALMALGKETIEFYLERYFQMSKSLEAGKLVPSREKTKKGEIAENRWSTAGFIAAAIIERGDYEKYKKPVELLMAFMMGKLREDGIFKTQFAQSQYFMPGQALLAFAYVYEASKDEQYKAFFNRVIDAYEHPLRAMLHLGHSGYAPLAPAWFTQPLTRMWMLDPQQRYQELIFLINDRVAKWYELNAAFAKYFDEDGILAPKPGANGNNSVTAASLESLVDAAYVAKKVGDVERHKRYLRIVKRTTAYLIRLQYQPVNTFYIRGREKVVGGFKHSLHNNLVWCDNVWHLSSAFMKALHYELL